MAVLAAGVYGGEVSGQVLLGIVLALGTSVSWAFGNVFVQRSSHRLGGVRAMTWSLALGAVVAGAAALALDDRQAPLTASVIVWTLVSGAAGLVAYAGLFYAFTHGQLSLTVPFTSCWSLVAALFGLVMFDERPTSAQLLGAGVVFLGVLLVSVGLGLKAATGERGADQRRKRHASLGALLSGVAFGVMMPAMNQASPAVGVFGSAALAYILCLLLGIPIALALGLDLRRPDPGGWPAVAGAGLFETAGFVFLTFAGLTAPMALVAPVASLASVLTLLYAFIFLRERPGSLALIGALLASVGVVLLAIR